ncbi:MAG: ATP-binding protein [Candidatus Omnitrophota bacterium]|nr:ATP-binding protein [Candidatus Omnitrophota bacterium]
MPTQFLIRNLDIVYLIYGFSFMILAVAILVQPHRKSNFKIAEIIGILAAFGFTHGLNEFLDMIQIIKGSGAPSWHIARTTVLTLSFIFLFEFGRSLIALSKENFFKRKITVILSLFVFFLIFTFQHGSSIWPRYLLGFPGGIMTAVGFILYYKTNQTILGLFKARTHFYFRIAAIATGVYSALAGLIVPKAGFFPASFLNNVSFLNLTGIPVQIFRAICACLIAWSVFNILRIFNWEIISEFKSLREQLTAHERLAAMGKAAGAIGHEFKNQLGVMRNSIYFLNMNLANTGEKIKKHLTILEEQVIETNRTIENILSFATTKRLEFEPLNLKELLAHSINNLQVPAGIDLETHLPADTWEIKADKIQINRVFINIIINALEAMKNKGKLSITASRGEKFTTVIFQDTGPGIKEENKAKIFEPFFSTKSSGMGLGLSTSKAAIEAHGGQMEIISAYGQGTAVAIKIPVNLLSTKGKNE